MVNDPPRLYTSTPEDRLPSRLCLHSVALPVCACAPHLCMSTPDRFSSCSRRHSQLCPFRWCRSNARGVNLPRVHISIHSRRPLPLVCACQRTRGRPCSRQRSQPGFYATPKGLLPSCPHRRSQPCPPLKFQVQVWTLGSGSPNLLSPDPQVRFGPARWMNPVHQVGEPDSPGLTCTGISSKNTFRTKIMPRNALTCVCLSPRSPHLTSRHNMSSDTCLRNTCFRSEEHTSELQSP